MLTALVLVGSSLPAFSFELTGTASWYGPGFDGRLTATGEAYDSDKLTAASKTLKLNSLVIVTNKINGKSIVVRINDRGPYIGDRILDLSRHAAELLEFTSKGITVVRIAGLD